MAFCGIQHTFNDIGFILNLRPNANYTCGCEWRLVSGVQLSNIHGVIVSNVQYNSATITLVNSHCLRMLPANRAKHSDIQSPCNLHTRKTKQNSTKFVHLFLEGFQNRNRNKNGRKVKAKAKAKAKANE